MDFASLRAQATARVREQLRSPLPRDRALVLAWRCAHDRPEALERWLLAVLPHLEPQEARTSVAREGRGAWDPDGIGADMDAEGWKALQAICKGRAIDLEALARHAAKNLHALLGADCAAELLNAAGGLHALARMTQRDCMRLGDEAGQFGGTHRPSILERHELATNDRSLRVLASRAILAARLDAYEGQFKGEALRQEVLYAQ